MAYNQPTFFETSDIELARNSIMSKFGASRFEVTRHSHSFSHNCSRYSFKNVLLFRSCATSGVETEFPEADFVRQYFVRRGTGRILVGKKSDLEISPHVSAVVDPGRRIVVHTGPDLEHVILRINSGALKRKLGALLGMQIDQLPEFEKAVDLESPMMQNMAQAIRLFISDADAFAAHDSDLIRDEFEQAIIARFLFSHAHHYSSMLRGPSSDLSSPQFKLVEEYIEANWDKPLDFEGLAEISGLSVRSIFRQFKRVRNCTPVEFSKSVRLKQARLKLQSGDKVGDHEASVTHIARACGFVSCGHFAREYHEAFGEFPSQTLRAKKRIWRPS